MFKIRNEYENYITKTFRIPKEMTETLEELAKNHNTSANKVVIQCLEYALSSIEEEEISNNAEYDRGNKELFQG